MFKSLLQEILEVESHCAHSYMLKCGEKIGNKTVVPRRKNAPKKAATGAIQVLNEKIIAVMAQAMYLLYILLFTIS